MSLSNTTQQVGKHNEAMTILVLMPSLNCVACYATAACIDQDLSSKTMILVTCPLRVLGPYEQAQEIDIWIIIYSSSKIQKKFNRAESGMFT